ncbi:MAG: MurR/RpiR family transcriptional regulator [Peptococcaceae bacterium]
MNNLLKDLEFLYDEMTESHKKVAQYVMENIENIAFYTLDELANKIGVSTTTVIRFARNLGYAGYSDFLEEVQKVIKAKVGLPERLSVSLENVNHDQLLLDSFNQDIINIKATLEGLSPDKLDKAIDMIMAAKNVYVIGLRTSFSLAHSFAMSLGQIRENVRLIQGAGSSYPEECLGVGPDDLCVSFTFPRHARVTLEITGWMKKRGTKVIAITQSLLSPIVEFADIILPCEVKGIMFKHSMAAPLCLINYLVAGVAVRDEEEAMRVLSKTEQLLRQFHYFGV